MGSRLLTQVWRSELPISPGTSEFLEQGYSSKRRILTPRCLLTPNHLATKLSLNVGCALPGNPGNPPWNRQARGLFGLTHRLLIPATGWPTIVSRSVWIYLLAGVLYLLLNQVPSALALQPKCSDTKVYSRESLFTRQPSEEAEEQISSPLPWRQGFRVFMGERNGASELWEGSGGEDKETLR